MARRLFANNLEMTLLSAIGPSDNTITVDDASGAPSIQLGSGDYFKLTIEDPTTGANREIVHALQVIGNTIIIARGQEGTTAVDHSAGSVVDNRNTAETLDSFPQRDDAEEITGKYEFALHPSVLGQDVWNSDNVTSSDDQILAIVGTDPEVPLLELSTNVPFGTIKLDANGNVPLDQLPLTGLQPLGPFRGDDECPKPGDDPGDCTVPDYRNPSERFPGVTFASGQFYIITTAGNVNLIDPGTGLEVVTVVTEGDFILYAEGVGQPPVDGWFLVRRDTTIFAVSVVFDDTNTTIKGTNVQAWNEAADARIDAVEAASDAADATLRAQKVDRAGDTMTGDLEIVGTEPAFTLEDQTVGFEQRIEQQVRIRNYTMSDLDGDPILAWNAGQAEWFTNNRKILTDADLGSLGDYTRRNQVEAIEQPWEFQEGLNLGINKGIRVGNAGPDYALIAPTDTTGWVDNGNRTFTHTPGTTSPVLWTDALPSATALLAANQVGEYLCTITIVGRTAGTVSLDLSGTSGTPRDANGVFPELLTTAGRDILITPSSDFDGTVGIIVRFASLNLVTSAAQTATLGNPFTNTVVTGQNIGFVGAANFAFQPFVLANQIWHEGNQGSGSGLDADTLDGLHADQIGKPLTTQDPQTLDVTNGATEVDVTTRTNIADGLAKLNAAAKIPPSLLPVSGLSPLGVFRGDNDCPKPGDDPGDCTEPDTRNPSERFPTVTFNGGEFFLVSSGGDINLISLDTLLPTVTPVDAGDIIVYVLEIDTGSIVYPEGWYYVPRETGLITAAEVLFDDSGTTIKGTTVQAWNEAADTAISGKTNRVGGENITGNWTFQDQAIVRNIFQVGGGGVTGADIRMNSADAQWISRLVQNNSGAFFTVQGQDVAGGGGWVSSFRFRTTTAVIEPVNAAPGGGILNELGSASNPWNRIHVNELLIDGGAAWHDNQVTLGGAHTATGAWTFNANVTIGSAGILTIDRTGDNITPLIASSGSATIAQFRSTGANNNLRFTFDGGLERFLGYTSAGLLRTGDAADLNGSGLNIWNDGLTTLAGNHTATGNWTYTGANRTSRNPSGGNYLTTTPTRSFSATYDVVAFENSNATDTGPAMLMHFSSVGSSGAAAGRFGLINLTGGNGAFVWQGRNGAEDNTVERMRLTISGGQGRLAINATDNASYALNVGGSGRFSGTLGVVGASTFTGAITAESTIQASTWIQAFTSSAERVVIFPSGLQVYRASASYYDNRTVASSVIFRTSNAADRDTNALTISANGVITGANQMRTSAAAPSAANDLTRKDYVDGALSTGLAPKWDNNTATLGGTHTASGAWTFSANVVCSAAAPTAASHLTRKDYVDGLIAGGVYNTRFGRTTGTGGISAGSGGYTVAKGGVGIYVYTITGTNPAGTWSVSATIEGGAPQTLTLAITNIASGSFRIIIRNSSGTYIDVAHHFIAMKAT